MTRSKINRRTLLKSVGAATIGLPLLEEMILSKALATTPSAPIPERAFNVFFGLGIPAPLQTEGFDGVLEPLKPLSDKLLIMRNVDHVRCDQSGINAHFDGASAAFTATAPQGEAKAGGPSIDQMVRAAQHPDGMPPGMIPTLCAGTFFRRSRITRFVHSFNRDGTIAGRMLERPRDVFDRVFGTIAGNPDSRAGRFNRSVLDSVVEQYKLFTGQRSPLGQASRRRVADHLDRIREYEQRAFRPKGVPPAETPPAPPASKVAHGRQADPNGAGIDMKVEELVREWRLLADIYALAIQTDRVRFGSITFLAAGERIRLKGEYTYEGRKIFDFDDGKHLNSTGPDGCSHEWWHKFDPQQENQALRAHAHLKMREIAYFMQQLAGDESIEANGRTILENSLLTISTESGDGRHNNFKRELSGVFHAITPANGRFKTGQIMDVNQQGIDVYNSMLARIGVQDKMGPQERQTMPVDSIMA